jgi:hypothetical protein
VKHITIEWRDDAPANLAKLAVGRCMATVMDEGMWKEVGLLTDTLDQIEGHSRLLRSLSFGDDDYEGHVLDMTGRVLGERRRHRPIPGPLYSRVRSSFPTTRNLGSPTWIPLPEVQLGAVGDDGPKARFHLRPRQRAHFDAVHAVEFDAIHDTTPVQQALDVVAHLRAGSGVRGEQDGFFTHGGRAVAGVRGPDKGAHRERAPTLACMPGWE